MRLPAFQTLLDDHGPAVWRYLVASLGPHDAADCFQETVVAALRGYDALTHDGNLGGWLFTIAHRKVVDHARARVRRPAPSGAVPEVGRTDPEADGWVWAHVAALPPKQRSAVLLRYLDDRPYAEVAEIIGCSEAAARQNVRAGLARLRQEVEP